MKLNNVQHCCPLAEDHTAEHTPYMHSEVHFDSSGTEQVEYIAVRTYLLSPVWCSETMASSNAFIWRGRTQWNVQFETKRKSAKHLPQLTLVLTKDVWNTPMKDWEATGELWSSSIKAAESEPLPRLRPPSWEDSPSNSSSPPTAMSPRRLTTRWGWTQACLSLHSRDRDHDALRSCISTYVHTR